MPLLDEELRVRIVPFQAQFKHFFAQKRNIFARLCRNADVRRDSRIARSEVGKVGFVVHDQPLFARNRRVHRRVLRRERRGGIENKEHEVGALDEGARAADADALHLARVLADARRVVQIKTHAADFDGVLHHVARCSRNGGDDRLVRAEQRVQNGTFARVRAPRQHDGDPLLYLFSHPVGGGKGGEFARNMVDFFAHVL